MPFRLSVGTNWDPALLEQTASYPIADFYGASPAAAIGGIPPDRLGSDVARLGKREVEAHIREIRRQGRTFTYILNEPTLGARELRPEVVRRVRSLLDWVAGQDIEYVTIAIPFLIRLARRHYPRLKIKASFNAMIRTVEQARAYRELGVDLVCLHVSLNYDFERLRAIVQALDVPVQVLVAENVVRSCINMHNAYHTNATCALASGFFGAEPDADSNRVVGFVQSWCHDVRMTRPEEILKGCHIRPEDLPLYEAIGIHDFKISPRAIATPGLVRRVRAWCERRYDGNLLDIVNVFPFWNRFQGVEPRTPSNGAGDPAARDFEALRADPDQPRMMVVDNRRLDGFLERFARAPCPPSCRDCTYCREWAERAIRVDDALRARYLEVLRRYRASLAGGAGAVPR